MRACRAQIGLKLVSYFACLIAGTKRQIRLVIHAGSEGTLTAAFQSRKKWTDDSINHAAPFAHNFCNENTQ